MAEKRMFSKRIIDTDAFLEMSSMAQLLYFHLSMRADDDGFVDKPKSIMRLIGAKDDDMMMLVLRSFVLIFDTGLLVIKHWRINNYLRSDRYKPTNFFKEKEQLNLIDEVYEFKEESLGIPNGVPTGTISISKSNSIIDDNSNKGVIGGKEKEEDPQKRFSKPTIEEVRAYCLERKNNVDPEQFVDFYSAKGWKVGNSPMKDWKACVRTWEKRSPNPKPIKNNYSWNNNNSKNPPLDENGNIDYSCGGTFRGTIL